VLALTHSLQHELKDKNVRVQAVLPGATATEFWDIAGTPVAHLPGEIVMKARTWSMPRSPASTRARWFTVPSLPEARGLARL
jgi:short-subunit dehydrogenase